VACRNQHDKCPVPAFTSISTLRQLYENGRRSITNAPRSNCYAPDARSTGSRHSSFGFNQWMLRYSVRGQVCEGLVAKAAEKKAKRTAKQGEEAGAESGFAA
jgi:hypothetical protein